MQHGKILEKEAKAGQRVGMSLYSRKAEANVQRACSVQPCQSLPSSALARFCTAQFTQRLLCTLSFPRGLGGFFFWSSDEWLTRLLVLL